MSQKTVTKFTICFSLFLHLDSLHSADHFTESTGCILYCTSNGDVNEQLVRYASLTEQGHSTEGVALCQVMRS